MVQDKLKHVSIRKKEDRKRNGKEKEKEKLKKEDRIEKKKEG